MPTNLVLEALNQQFPNPEFRLDPPDDEDDDSDDEERFESSYVDIFQWEGENYCQFHSTLLQPLLDAIRANDSALVQYFAASIPDAIRGFFGFDNHDVEEFADIYERHFIFCAKIKGAPDIQVSEDEHKVLLDLYPYIRNRNALINEGGSLAAEFQTYYRSLTDLQPKEFIERALKIQLHQSENTWLPTNEAWPILAKQTTLALLNEVLTEYRPESLFNYQPSADPSMGSELPEHYGALSMLLPSNLLDIDRFDAHAFQTVASMLENYTSLDALVLPPVEKKIHQITECADIDTLYKITHSSSLKLSQSLKLLSNRPDAIINRLMVLNSEALIRRHTMIHLDTLCREFSASLQPADLLNSIHRFVARSGVGRNRNCRAVCDVVLPGIAAVATAALKQPLGYQVASIRHAVANDFPLGVMASMAESPDFDISLMMEIDNDTFAGIKKAPYFILRPLAKIFHEIEKRPSSDQEQLLLSQFMMRLAAHLFVNQTTATLPQWFLDNIDYHKAHFHNADLISAYSYPSKSESAATLALPEAMRI